MTPAPATPPRSYRDVLSRRERRRPDGRPVWPLTDADLSSRITQPSPRIIP